MTMIWTAQYAYRGPDRVDITMKCPKTSIGTAFQPGWDIVMSFKNGTITEAQYRALYLERMRVSYNTNKPYWDVLLNMLEVTLVCFCPADTFCHRLILGEYVLPKCSNIATYKGERRPNETW